jgi:hypothetical protein
MNHVKNFQIDSAGGKIVLGYSFLEKRILILQKRVCGFRQEPPGMIWWTSSANCPYFLPDSLN